jgi:hypothetical protein
VIQWPEPDSNGDPIVDYKVYWDQAINVYVEIASSTYGQRTFTVNLDATGLDEGKSFYFKVSAVNSIGEGELSFPYLVVAATVPDAPTQLTRNNQLTSRSVLSLTWSNGVSDGGSEIIDYKVQFD